LLDAATGAIDKEITMTGKLAGKMTVVTGGSAGIGLGIAERFAQEGARVFIIGRRQAQLDQAVAEIGGDAAAIQGDISNLADLDRVYATVKAQAGYIDVLAVNAGVYEFGTLGGDHRGAVRQDVQHGRTRRAVYRAKSVAFAAS
jgi:NAD(P)-dependent dehydrogenase (short-subunit alcohol dehydrogenase family)